MAAEAAIIPCGRKVLTMDTMNPNVKAINFQGYTELFVRAIQLQKELDKGAVKTFEQVVLANAGDIQACWGQKPITFLRQVVALCTYPALLDSSEFPEDAKNRARRILNSCRGQSIGSYSDSVGIEVIRRDVADYITRRDGVACDYENIVLCAGATDGIEAVIELLMTGKDERKAGVLVPIPQYPLYMANVAEFNGCSIPYYLDEDNDWSLDISELQKSVDAAREHCIPRAIVVINPGNPTGQVLSRQTIENVIKFAKKERLFILADEVYQNNVNVETRKFQSFKKVVSEMGSEYANLEMASFMSASKGYTGECGYRGGYFEILNLDQGVKRQLITSITVKTCPNASGQIAVDVIVNPPREDEPSYELFQQEKNRILGDIALKAKMTTEAFNQIEGIRCNEVMGSMYAFPRIFLPDKAIQEAKKKGMVPDTFYCVQLLEETGLGVLSGSCFGQKEGTYHFRMAILPPVEHIQRALERFKEFHVNFMKKYS